MGLLALTIVAGGAIGPALLTAGLVDTPAATASLLLNMELVATVILAATLFREHLGRNMILAAMLVTTAGVLLVWEPGATVNASGTVDRRRLRLLGTRQQRHVTHRSDQPPACRVPERCRRGQRQPRPRSGDHGSRQRDGWSIVGALVIGMVGYGASITLWVRGAQQLGAARGQVIFATAPFLGAVLAWITLGDSIDAVQVDCDDPRRLRVLRCPCDQPTSIRHRHTVMEHTHEHDHDDEHHDHSHADGFVGRHSHVHTHHQLVHAHAHVPDLHHRHHD